MKLSVSARSALGSARHGDGTRRFAGGGRSELLCWSMGLKSRCRGRRPQVIAVACGGVLAAILAAVPLASGQSAQARPVSRAFAASRPDPLAHAPRFRRALGPQTLMQPAGVAADPAGGGWVADTGHDRVVGFSSDGRGLGAFGENLEQPAGIATGAAGQIWVAETPHDRGGE